MTTMEILCLIALTTLSNLGCFLIGARTGQKVVKGETVEIPKPKSPVAIYKEYQQSKEEQKAEEEFKHNLDVINNYDGNI